MNNYNPESLLVKDKFFTKDASPFMDWSIDDDRSYLDTKKITLVDSILLDKKPISSLNFDKNRFLGECLGNEEFKNNFGYFELSKSGIKKLINDFCESGDGLPWIDMPKIFYKHLCPDNVCKQYAGLSYSKAKSAETLLREFVKHNKEKPTLTFKQFFDLFEANFYKATPEDSLLIVDKIAEVAKTLGITVEPIFEKATDEYFTISEEEFDQAVSCLYKSTKIKDLKRMIINYKKLFNNWYEEKFYKTLVA